MIQMRVVARRRGNACSSVRFDITLEVHLSLLSKFRTSSYVIFINCSKLSGFRYRGIQLRSNENNLLNDINSDKSGRLLFPVLADKGKHIQTGEEKIFVLANDFLTGDPYIHDLFLTQDMNFICANGCRISKCMKEYFIYQKNYKGTLNSSLLRQIIATKTLGCQSLLAKKLPGIRMVTAKALQSMGNKSFESLANSGPRRIEIVTGRKYPFGNH